MINEHLWWTIFNVFLVQPAFEFILAFIFTQNRERFWSLNFAILFGRKFEKIYINVEFKRLTCSFIGTLVKDACQSNWLMGVLIPLKPAFA